MSAVREQPADDPLAAAQEAFLQGRPSTAIDLLRDAPPGLRLGPDGRLLLARAYVALQRDVEAGAVLAELLADPDLRAEERTLARALQAMVVTITTDPARGRELAVAVLRDADPAGSAAAMARFALCRATMYDGDLPRATRIAERALFAATDVLPDERADIAAQLVYLHLQQDRFDEAEAAAARAADAVPPPTPRLLALLRRARGAARFHAGRWDGIEDLLDPRRDVEAGIEVGDDAIGGVGGLLAVVLIHRDRLDAARDLLARSLASLVTGQRPFLLWASMLMAEAAGDARGTREHADRLIASFELLGSPGGLRIYGLDLVRVLVDHGDRGRARELTATLEARVAASGTRSVAATALLMRGIVEADADRLRRAAEAFRASGRPLETAIARERLGDVLAPRDPIGAIAAYRDALAASAGLGATRDQRRVEAALRQLGAGTGRRGPRTRETVGWRALSPSELAVARLVAEGLTNSEIGVRLSISPRTVETHVAHALTKLAARNRAELAAVATREAGPP